VIPVSFILRVTKTAKEERISTVHVPLAKRFQKTAYLTLQMPGLMEFTGLKLRTFYF
jgi:hypothetical protein